MEEAADAEWEKLQQKIKDKLNKHFIVKTIIRESLRYFGYSPRIIIASRARHAAYIKQMVCYICHSVYGVQASIVCEQLKCDRNSVFYSNNIVAEKLPYDKKCHSDLENIRERLNKCIKQ